MFILGGCDDGTVGPVGGWSGAILGPPTAPVTPSLCNTNLRRHVISNRIKSPEIGLNPHLISHSKKRDVSRLDGPELCESSLQYLLTKQGQGTAAQHPNLKSPFHETVTVGPFFD